MLRRTLLFFCALLLLTGAARADEDTDFDWEAFIAKENATQYMDFICETTYSLNSTPEQPWAYLYGCTIDTLCLNSHTAGIEYEYTDIRNFAVPDDNPYFTVVDGVLFSKDGKTLVRYPMGRTDAHYTLPAGVTAIAYGAFSDAVHLTGISLPFGLESIGEYAFYRTGLTHIAVPLTVRSIGDGAFYSCVNLESCALPPALTDGNNDLFSNNPLLSNRYTGRENVLGAPEGDYRSAWETSTSLPVYAAPANVNDKVYAYAAPNGKVKKAEFRCAEYIGLVNAYDSQWYTYEEYFCDDNETVYIRRSEVVPQPGGTLFEYDTVQPVNGNVKLYEYDYDRDRHVSVCTVKTLTKYLAAHPDDYWIEDPASIRLSDRGSWTMDIGWCSAHGAENGEEWEFYFQACDAAFTRVPTGDGRTFGVVIASQPDYRVNLRKKPDTSSDRLGHFFTGTQAEILESKGKWYRVRINDTVGWMMKEYVVIVPQRGE